MITSIYAALLAILIVGLSLNVIKLRQIGQVILGDGYNLELKSAIRSQGNATEYIPISLILLLLLELSKGHWSLLHIGGIVLLTGRLIHARGLLKGNLRFRVLGMQLTLFNIIYLAIAPLRNT
ncbi:MAG: MAPEG family protein [Pseudanabaena sp.]